MKIKIKTFIIFLLFISISGCSYVSEKLDIATMIDKTESWLFDEEKDEQKNQQSSEENQEGNDDFASDTEEFFPDINEIPEERPTFEEIDEDFFSEETEESELSDISPSDDEKGNNKLSGKINKQESSIKRENILSVIKIRENIRFRLRELLINSDPPVDKSKDVIKKENEFSESNLTKVAIIQFPNNSIIPDESSVEVIEELTKFYNSKRIRLIGHASRTGSETTEGKRKNMEISIARAETIKNMLINKGFSADRIDALGKGDIEPLKDETKEYGEAVNRRVEIFFISE